METQSKETGNTDDPVCTDSPSSGILHCRSLDDLGCEGIQQVVSRAIELKKLRGTSAHPTPLRGKSVGILLEKSSTRTRVSFETGIWELGGHPQTMVSKDIQLGRGEPLEDTARILSGYLHAIVYRTFGHDRIECLVNAGSIPVINGLSDDFHPCQVLADLQTVKECFGTLRDLCVAWIGDGNNMAHSWMLAAHHLGFELRIAAPSGYLVDQSLLKRLQSADRSSHTHFGKIVECSSAEEAVAGAHVVTTDVWASMGQEEESRQRMRAFANYAVTSERMKLAHDDAIFLHCLPAHRGEEVTAEVIDGPQSRIFQEAENRLHAQKALLERLVV